MPTAKQDAERTTAAILERVAAVAARLGPTNQPLRLATYPTEADYRDLRPFERWSWAHHTAVTRQTARNLKRAGHKIDLIPCTGIECREWLKKHHLPNTTDNRALYIAHKTNPSTP